AFPGTAPDSPCHGMCTDEISPQNLGCGAGRRRRNPAVGAHEGCQWQSGPETVLLAQRRPFSPPRSASTCATGRTARAALRDRRPATSRALAPRAVVVTECEHNPTAREPGNG